MPEGKYDSVLIVSFGGPENAAEVIPFLENVLRGKNVPSQRLLEVAGHYYHFGGKSPINDQNRQLIAAVRGELEQHGPALPVYWGNRNWHPLLADTLREMRQEGRTRALAFTTSAFSSYSGCRQYREDLVRARAEAGPGAPEIDKLRVFYNHPTFIEAWVDRVREAFAKLAPSRQADAHLLFTAHSIPLFMAQTSDYQHQLEEACKLVSEAVGHPEWKLVYQSRSGPKTQPWLGPDITDALRDIRYTHTSCNVVVVPIGFMSDHMEVLYDLDTEARAVCIELALNMVRARTVGVHPKVAQLVRELIVERMESRERCVIGQYGPEPDECDEDCCPGPAHLARRLERVR